MLLSFLLLAGEKLQAEEKKIILFFQGLLHWTSSQRKRGKACNLQASQVGFGACKKDVTASCASFSDHFINVLYY